MTRRSTRPLTLYQVCNNEHGGADVRKGRCPMTTTIQAQQPPRAGSITLDSWQNMLVLAQKPDRHRQTMWVVRLSLGDLPR